MAFVTHILRLGRGLTTRRCSTTLRGLAAGLCLAGFGGVGGANAQFGLGQDVGSLNPTLSFKTDYLGYAASVSPRFGFTDNINLARDELKESEYIATTLLSGNAIYSARAFTGLISGDLDLSYLANNEDFNVNQRIAGVGTATIKENLFYFDVSGSTSRQLIGDNARFSANLNAARNQRTDVHTYSMSPYLNTRFENGSAAEVRYRFSQVFVDNETGDVPGAGFLNDSLSHELIAAYDTGDIFQRLKMRFTAYGARTDESGAISAPEFEYEQGSLFAEVEYELTRKLAFTGGVGVDEIRSDAPPEIIPADELSGLSWLAGFRYRPSRRTDLLLQYGERFGDDYVNANLNYRLSDRLFVNANASRQFRTRAQAVNSQFALSQRSVLEFADNLRQGGEASPNGIIDRATQNFANLNAAQTIGVAASDNASIGITALFDRTTMNASVNYSDDDFGFRRIETIGGDAGIQTQLSRRTSLYGDVFFRVADTAFNVVDCVANPAVFGFNPNEPLFDASAACTAFADSNGELTTVGGRVGARYRFFRNLSAFAEYSRTSRFADEELLEFDENFVQAGLVLDL